MFDRLYWFLLCIAVVFAMGGGVLASPRVRSNGQWKDPDTVLWKVSLQPDWPVPGGDTADVELQIAFEFARDLLDVPTLVTDELTPLPTINPYTGEMNEGLSILYDVPSQFGTDGNVNVLFLSYAGSDVRVRRDALRLTFSTEGGSGIFYEGIFK